MKTKIIIITLLTVISFAVQNVSTSFHEPLESNKPIRNTHHINTNNNAHENPLPVEQIVNDYHNQQQAHQATIQQIERTHISWKRESSFEGLSNEYYVEDHEAIPVVQHTVGIALGDPNHQHAQQVYQQQPQQPQQQYQSSEIGQHHQQQLYHQQQHYNPEDAHRAQPQTAQPLVQSQQQLHNYQQHYQHHEQPQQLIQQNDQLEPQHQHLYQQHYQQQQQQQPQINNNHQAQAQHHIYQPYYQSNHQALPTHQRVVYSRLVNEDHIYESLDYIQSNLPLDSCGSNDYNEPNVLMPQHLPDEPTCRATTSSQQRQENIHINNNHQHHHHHQPTHGGYGFRTKTSTNSADSPERVPTFSQMNGRHNSNIDSYPLGPPIYPYESSLMAAIRHYWREVSGLCLASAIFLNWLFVAVKRRFITNSAYRAEQALKIIHQQLQQRDLTAATTTTNTTSTNNVTKASVSRDTNSYSAHDSAFEENIPTLSAEDEDLIISGDSSSNEQDQNKSQLDIAQVPVLETAIRQRSSTLKADPLPIPNASLTPNHHRSLSTSLSNSLNTNGEYNSRYSSDFDSIRRLGRGGFGVVFEAKNKIDDCHYAVKRICLPLEKEARERVMREVRALAKLDHAGIVRYYNAWLETPPDSWLEQHDAQLGILHSKDGLSFPSTDGIYERNESDPATGSKISNDAGDNSLSLFNDKSPFKTRKRGNGYRNLLKDTSNSPLLDIVFEGSGSIRVESEKINDDDDDDAKELGDKYKKRNKSANTDETYGRQKSLLRSGNNNEGDRNISDSEDSDFIQFESRNRDNNASCKLINDESVSSHLSDPFSSSSGESSNCGDDEQQEDEDECDVKGEGEEDSFSRRMEDDEAFVFASRRVNEARKRALAYRKEVKQSLSENLHVEKVYLYIQMQLCRKDTLKDWLKTNFETRDKTTIFDLFYQIVDAVEYVHSQDLIHRDLKPSNIFFSLDGTLKIGDFGLCRTKTNVGVGSSLDLQEYFGESDIERGIEAVHTEQVGTQLYMSPEQLNGLGYNQKVDIFAMGLILLELLIPFKTQMQRVNVLFKARNNVYTNEFRDDHPKEHELVRSLLSRNPQKRPTASEIKQHELLASAQLSQPVIERIYHRRRTISSNSSTE